MNNEICNVFENCVTKIHMLLINVWSKTKNPKKSCYKSVVTLNSSSNARKSIHRKLI